MFSQALHIIQSIKIFLFVFVCCGISWTSFGCWWLFWQIKQESCLCLWPSWVIDLESSTLAATHWLAHVKLLDNYEVSPTVRSTWSASQNLVLGSGLITWLSPASLKMIENSENRMEMNWAVAHTHKLSHDFVIVSTCHIEYFYNGFFFCYLFCFLACHLNDHLLSLKMNYSLNLIYLQFNFWFWLFLELTFF